MVHLCSTKYVVRRARQIKHFFSTLHMGCDALLDVTWQWIIVTLISKCWRDNTVHMSSYVNPLMPVLEVYMSRTKIKVFCKKTNHYFLGVVKHTGIKWLQKDADFKLSGHIAIPTNTIVFPTDCLFGVTEAGLALKNTVMPRENMFYFINCWVTESKLANKTVFPTPVFIKDTHTALEPARRNF